MARFAQRLVLEDVDRGHPGPAGAQRADQRAGLDQPGAAGVDEQRRRLHAREIGGASRSRAWHRRDACAARSRRTSRRTPPCSPPPRSRRLPRAFARRLARPDEHVHAERAAVAGDDRADPAVAVDAERLAAQRVPTPICQLPACSDATCCGIWRIAASTSPHVSSAVAYDGVPACMVDETMMPSRVQASMSICG